MMIGFRTQVWGSLIFSIGLSVPAFWLCPHEKTLNTVGSFLQGIAVVVALFELNRLDKRFNETSFIQRLCPKFGKNLSGEAPTRGARSNLDATLTLSPSKPPTLEERVLKLEAGLVEATSRISSNQRKNDGSLRKLAKHVGVRMDKVESHVAAISGVAEEDVGRGYAILIFASIGTIVSILSNFLPTLPG